MEDFSSSPQRQRPRPRRRPERQQVLLRRGLALVGALVVVILVVLGVKGCLDARAQRALSDYSRNVSQIVKETEQTSKALFGKLKDPGNLSVKEFVNAVNADRSAMDNYASRIDGLDTPGDMDSAQRNLELVYSLRSNAVGEIADKMPTALGEAGAEKAVAGIANQMRKLLAGDVLYEEVVRPEIDGVLESNGIDDSDLPKSAFLPAGTKWLNEDTVSSALGSISGSSGGAVSPGVHGLELTGVSVNGTELAEGVTNSVVAEGTVEVEVSVQNQGESTENGVKVSVSVDGGNTLQGEIDEIEAGETSSTSIPLTPTPSGQVTLEAEAEPVPGEQVAENNEAAYTVAIE